MADVDAALGQQVLDVAQDGPAPLEGPGNNDPGSEIDPRVYGPSGQEIGAVFNMRTG